MDRSKVKNLSKTQLSRLNSRLQRTESAGGCTLEALLAGLRQNLQAQKVLAEWQAILRDEQEILLSRIQTANS